MEPSGRPPVTLPEILPIEGETSIARAADVLRRGGLVVVPTDTVYGLAASLDDPAAIDRVFAIKGRSASKPLPVLLSSPDRISLVAADHSPAIARFAARFWPGPLTQVVPARAGLPPPILGPDRTVGVRVPDHPGALRLIEAAGGALAVTSANRSGEPPARSALEAVACLGDQIDLVLDGGSSPDGLPSTVARFEQGRLRVLRPGPITEEALAAAWAEAVGLGDGGG